MTIDAGLRRLLPAGREDDASQEEVDRAAALLAAATAEAGENADDAQDDEEEEEEEMGGEGAQDDEEEEEEEETETSGDDAQAARVAERTRIAGILRSGAAKGREPQALVLALDTDLSVAQAEQLLKASPKASAKHVPSRMPTCIPEMASRCDVPVSRNSSTNSSGRPLRIPSSSAWPRAA